MAFLRKTSKSSYWVLKFRDIETGRWREESTKLRHDDPADTRKADRLCQAASEREAKVSPDGDAHFIRWVPGYIAGHYTRSASKKRYDIVWQNISKWIKVRNVRHPRQVKYEHAKDFMDWRKEDGASHNTARLELKFFSFIMQEAMRRDHCEKNPLALAKIEKTVSKEKADLSPADLLACREAFKGRPTWMRTVFEICASIGCRFAEASVPMSNVDFVEGVIWIVDSKRKEGDPRKRYPVPMPEGLSSYLSGLVGQDRTAPVPNRKMNSRFNDVLKSACGVTSHSLRVAFISRCHRAGLSESQAMRLVNHSTEAVHRIYTRLSLGDARVAMARVEPPPL
jgi:site-specific recombinase XerD